MRRAFHRLADNAASVAEGAFIFLELTLAGLVLGVLWAAREIYDSWTLE